MVEVGSKIKEVEVVVVVSDKAVVDVVGMLVVLVTCGCSTWLWAVKNTADASTRPATARIPNAAPIMINSSLILVKAFVKVSLV